MTNELSFCDLFKDWFLFFASVIGQFEEDDEEEEKQKKKETGAAGKQRRPDKKH